MIVRKSPATGSGEGSRASVPGDAVEATARVSTRAGAAIGRGFRALAFPRDRTAENESEQDSVSEAPAELASEANLPSSPGGDNGAGGVAQDAESERLAREAALLLRDTEESVSEPPVPYPQSEGMIPVLPPLGRSGFPRDISAELARQRAWMARRNDPFAELLPGSGGEAVEGQYRVSPDEPTRPGDPEDLARELALPPGIERMLREHTPSSHEAHVRGLAQRLGVPPAPEQERPDRLFGRAIPIPDEATVPKSRHHRPARRRFPWHMVGLGLACLGAGLGGGVGLRDWQTANPEPEAPSLASQPPTSPVTRTFDSLSPALLSSSEATVSQSLDLYVAQLVERRAKLLRFGARVRPGAELEPGAMAELRRAASDSTTSVEALSILARMGAADVIYSVWSDSATEHGAAVLARDLSYSTELRAKATPALAAVLDLKAAKTCDELVRAVSRARLEADQRALFLLRRLANTNEPCAPGGPENCHSCVGKSFDFQQVITAVEARPSPK